MNTPKAKEKKDEYKIRSFADFRKRFYPKPVDTEDKDSTDPEELGEKLAKDYLSRLQAALAAS